MRSRILFDPTPVDGGGAASNPTVTPPATTPATTPATVTVPPPATVTIPVEQLSQFNNALASLAQLQAEKAQAERDKQAAIADRKASEGKAEEALTLVRSQAQKDLDAEKTDKARIERIAKTSWRDKELTLAIAAIPNLVDGAAEKLLKLYRDDFDTATEGDTYKVQNRLFQSPSDFLKAELAKTENALFLKPSTKGGAGGGGDKPADDKPAAPMSVSEALIQHANLTRGAGNINGAYGLAPRAPSSN